MEKIYESHNNLKTTKDTIFHIIYVNNTISDRNEDIVSVLRDLYKYRRNDVVTIYFVGKSINKVIPFVPITKEIIDTITNEIEYISQECFTDYDFDKLREFTFTKFDHLINKNVIYINFGKQYD